MYGIDLGTTNSLIGYNKTLYTGLVKSSVNLKSEQLTTNVLEDGYIGSYKINMTTGFTGDVPRKASSILLRKLVDMANEITGKDDNQVVVSVPAKFSPTQRDAVKKSAEMAGLELKGLINEPTAAALCVAGQGTEYVLVFDLGGGTFDISIVELRDKVCRVICTDGLIVAGDDLDKELLDMIVERNNIPILLRSKPAMSQALMDIRKYKEIIQREKKDIPIELPSLSIKDTLTELDYVECVKEIFNQCIQLTETLLQRYQDAVPSKPDILFVGGSTNCPYLKAMVKKALDIEERETDIKPELLVAEGVALYAKLVEQGTYFEVLKEISSPIAVKLAGGRLKRIIDRGEMLPTSGCDLFTNDRKGSSFTIELYSGYDIIAKPKNKLGEVVINYSKEMEPEEGLVNLTISVDNNGLITLESEELATGTRSLVHIKTNV